MKKLLTITIAIILAMPQPALALRPMAKRHAREISPKFPAFKPDENSLLDDVISKVLARRRGFLAKLRSSEVRTAREIVDYILETGILEKILLIQELTNRAREARLQKTKRNKMDDIIMLAYSNIEEFIFRRLFIVGGSAVLAHALLHHPAEVVERAATVFAPRPEAVGLDLSKLCDLSRTHWQKGRHKLAIACQAWFDGASKGCAERYGHDPLLLKLASLSLDAFQKMTTLFVKSGQRNNLAIYSGLARAAGEYDLDMHRAKLDAEPKEAADQTIYTFETEMMVEHIQNFILVLRRHGLFKEAAMRHKHLRDLGEAFWQQGEFRLANLCRRDFIRKSEESIRRWEGAKREYEKEMERTEDEEAEVDYLNAYLDAYIRYLHADEYEAEYWLHVMASLKKQMELAEQIEQAPRRTIRKEDFTKITVFATCA